MWRRLFLITVIWTGILTGVGAALTSRRVANNLREYAEWLVSAEMDAKLSIAKLEITLLPPGVLVEDLNFEAPALSTSIHLHDGRIAIRPWPDTRMRPVIQILELDGLEGEISLRDFKTPTSGKSAPLADFTLPLLIQNLQLWNTRLDLHLEEGTLSIQRTDITVHPPGPEGRKFELVLDVGSWQDEERRIPFETRLRGQMQGKLHAPEGLNLTYGQIFLKEVNLGLKGELGLRESSKVNLTMGGHISLSQLQKLEMDIPQLSGEANLDIRVSGKSADPIIEGKSQVKNLVIAQKHFGDISIEARLTKRAVSISSFRIQEPTLGNLTGSGTLRFQKGFPLKLNTRLHNLSVPVLLEYAGISDAWIKMHTNADLVIEGHLQPFDLRMNMDGSTSDFLSLDRSYKKPNPHIFFALEKTSFNGDLRITPRGITLNSVLLKRNESEASLTGTLAYDVAGGMNIYVQASPVDLADFGTVTGVNYTGRGEMAITVEGPYNDPAIATTAKLAGFGLLGYKLGDTKATVIYESGKADVNRMTLRRGGGLATGAVEMDFFTPEGPQIKGLFTVEEWEIKDALTTLKVNRKTAHRFKGKISGDLNFEGGITFPEGSWAMNTRKLIIDGVSFGKGDFKGGFSPGKEPLWGEFLLLPLPGRTQGRIGLYEDGALSAQIKYEEFPMKLLPKFIGGVPVEGLATGSLQIFGPITSLEGTMTTRIENFKMYGGHFKTISLNSQLLDNLMTTRGTLIDGRATLKSTIRLGRQLPYTASIDFKNIPVEEMWSLGAKTSLVVSGDLFSQGDLMDPTSLMADISIPEATLDLHNVKLHQARDLKINFANLRYNLLDVQMVSKDLHLLLSGSGSWVEELDLKLTANGNLSTIAYLLPGIRHIQGDFMARTAITGDPFLPDFAGEVDIQNSRLGLNGLNQSFDDLSARLSFAGRSLLLDHARANFGGGIIEASGQASLPTDSPGQIDFHTQLRDVSLELQDDLDLRFNADLGLAGPLDDLLLSGQVDLNALRYAVALDLDPTKLIPRGQTRPLRVPVMPPEQTIRLNVKVEAADNIIVTNNIVETELSADLTVTGTTANVGLIGSMTPLWATVRYRENNFKVEQATIDFSGEHRIFTLFDLRLTTDACGMRVAVDIHGDSEHYNVTPTGSDETGQVDPQDVLMCLQFGLRLRDYEGHNAATIGTTIRDALPGSLDALWMVSGMDQKVRRMIPANIIDEVRLTSAWSPNSRRTTTQLKVGKDIGDRLQLHYTRALDEVADQSLSVEYQLSDIATLQGSWLSLTDLPVGDLGLDLRLRWEFE
ncbi:translocation/assembly module TamB domain-containing protein [Myxococcota bacterium]|nr:translocation/assembly module TamB domain-containing protein [Myxococcota bacterium]